MFLNSHEPSYERVRGDSQSAGVAWSMAGGNVDPLFNVRCANNGSRENKRKCKWSGGSRLWEGQSDLTDTAVRIQHHGDFPCSGG